MAPIPKPRHCAFCNKEFFWAERKGRGKYCSEECSSQPMSEESRKKISEGRKKFLQENPDKHPWKRKTNSPSAPAETVKSWLIKREIHFVSEMSPLEDRNFSIDIAFPHIKIGVEINGNQHYNSDGTLRKYYQDRHDLFVQAGWKIIEVHYSMCYNEENYKKIFDFDISFDHEGIAKKYFARLASIKLEKELNPSLKRGQKQSMKYDAKWKDIKDTIFNYSIDFSKFGWVQKVSKILGIIHSKVNGWMKRYHLKFYNEVCFKRKTEDQKVVLKRIPKGETIRLKTDAKWESIKDEIFNQGIDFTKPKWSEKLGEFLNISRSLAIRWMKRYHINFYNTVCFKRKSKV